MLRTRLKCGACSRWNSGSGVSSLIRVAAAVSGGLKSLPVEAGTSRRSEGNLRFRNSPAGERRFEEGKNGRNCNQAQKRDVIGKQVKALRRAGGLPAILYGSGIDPTPILMDAREAGRILKHISSSALLTLEVDGDRHLALVRDRQRNILLGHANHVDFQVVSRSEKLRTGVHWKRRVSLP
jgi:ribosomal protein L25 (general stress protein Ctc)